MRAALAATITLAIAAPADAQGSNLSGTATVLTSPGQAVVSANYREALRQLHLRVIAARGGVLAENDRARYQYELDDIQRWYRNNRAYPPPGFTSTPTVPPS